MSHLQLLPLEEQVALVEQYELDTLLFCHDAWALRHTFTNTQTGETVRRDVGRGVVRIVGRVRWICGGSWSKQRSPCCLSLLLR